MTELRVVGHNVARVDGLEKVTGAARYIADVKLPGMLQAKVLRSPYPHARILNVDTGAARRVAGVYAVGDCAAFWSARSGRRLRVEHWDTALHAPEVVAANLLGGAEDYDPVPYFWSEQFGRMVQYAGHHDGGDRLLWRGDPAGQRWAACWLAADRLVAVLTVGQPRDLLQGRRAIAAGAHVDPGRLADPDVPVRDAVIG